MQYRGSDKSLKKELEAFGDNIDASQFRALSDGLGVAAFHAKTVRADERVIAKGYDAPIFEEKSDDLDLSGTLSDEPEVLSPVFESIPDAGITSSFDEVGMKKAPMFNGNVLSWVKRLLPRILLGLVIDLAVVTFSLVFVIGIFGIYTYFSEGVFDSLFEALKWISAFKVNELLLALVVAVVAYIAVFKVMIGNTLGFRFVSFDKKRSLKKHLL